jgi:hypothetical protein
MAVQHRRSRIGSSLAPIVVGLGQYPNPGPVVCLSIGRLREFNRSVNTSAEGYVSATCSCQPSIPTRGLLLSHIDRP